ncbi:MAG: NACHT domain-containing protein, partial [Chloroflexi bacterium]|nr:NACHT domain-containing protein [Chloroflexota bacterium]
MDFIAAGVWLWDNFSKEIKDKVSGQFRKDWDQFRWLEAAKKYHARMKDLYSTMRVLGKPDPVAVEGIYTDVHILDRPTALRRFDIEQLRKEHEETRSLRGQAERQNALGLAKERDRLYVLGKPGAGKTTFLKFLTLQALDNRIERIPIFISLHEWSNSGQTLAQFIARQFEICAFPEAAPFIEHILKKGWAMVLFDGLDEVNVEGERRAALTTAINDFIKQYPKNKHIITCRIAASDYAFNGFTDVEIADFDSEQIKTFAAKWFGNDSEKAERFLDELEKAEHSGLRELAQTPLLLTLLCLSFEETLIFPPRRAEVYEEALEALLKKWDSARNIRRDKVYRGLSLGRKRQLFAQIAAEYFERGEIFFRQDDLAGRVETFMAKLPSAEGGAPPDGETIVKAIEAQHGIFVERARGIYSFSHLTLQEYFSARYVVENAAEGALALLIDNHFTDRRWREVLLLTASMLNEADTFIARFRRRVDGLVANDEPLCRLLGWAAQKALDYGDVRHPVLARALARANTDLALDLALALARDLDLDLDLALDLALALARARARARALALDRDR